MMLALIPLRVWLQIAATAAIIGAGWWAYTWAYNRGADSVQSLWDAEKQDIADQNAQLKADADKTTTALRDKADQLRRTKDAQINRLNADLATALDSLRDRPSRTGDGGVPKDTGTGTALGCTGAGLLRDDANFLAWYGAQTKRITLQLAQCQAEHASARDAIR